jgi:hypothetical protein
MELTVIIAELLKLANLYSIDSSILTVKSSPKSRTSWIAAAFGLAMTAI